MKTKKIILLLGLALLFSSCGSWVEILDASLRTTQKLERVTYDVHRTVKDTKDIIKKD